MAIALIDAAKENACRTAEANAIRAKAGGSSPIAYDFDNGKGFAEAISSIPAGGASLDDVFVYVLDFASDPISMTVGGYSIYASFFTT